MKSRWLSTFTLIGLLLLVLGVIGLVLQHAGTGFVFDPGQPPPADGHDRTALCYLVIGALMVLNGLILPVALPGEAKERKAEARPTREVVTTSADQTTE